MNHLLNKNRSHVFITYFKLLAIAACFFFSKNIKAQGIWTQVTNTAPDRSGGGIILLTDGTVMAKTETGGTGGIGTTWNKLTPDINGSYINGTWSTLAPMANSRLYFSTQVLKDGRVYVAGGEYGTGGSKGEVYNPLTDTWTATPNPGAVVSDANSEILNDGRVLQAMVSGSLKTTTIYNPVTNTYTTGPTCNGIHNESAWVKLQDNSILFVDRVSTNSERYIPALNQWTVDATVPVGLYDPFGDETGGTLLLPDGRAWFIGSPGKTAFYTPSGTNSPGTWTAGPMVLGGNGATDATAAMMTNGKILCAVSPTPTSSSAVFNSPTYFYEFDYLTNIFTPVPVPAGGAYTNQPSYIFNMLNLPDGNVLLSRQDTDVYYVYTPSGPPLAAGQPTISNIMQNGCNTFTITGKLFNGISEGSTYGDDWQNATNYPIVRLTSGSNVYYARTSNWNSTGVRRGNLPDTAQFVTPALLPVGIYSLVVIANGIGSAPVTFIPIPFLNSTLTPPSVCSNSTFTYLPASPVAGATFSWTRAAVTGISNPAITAPQSSNPNETLINTTAAPVNVVYNYTTAANGCSYVQQVTVTVNPQPTVTISGASTICAGSSAMLTASGAASYLWSNATVTASTSVSPTVTTTYSVTGTNSFTCSNVQTVTVTVNPLPVIAVSGTSVICAGSSATLTASGAATYTWNTASTNTSVVVSPAVSATYSVTGTSPLSCNTTQTFSVTVNPIPVIVINGTSVICNGDNTVLTASGAGTYTWSNAVTNASISVSPTITSSYSVTGNSSGCVGNQQITVVVNPLPVVSVSGTSVICSGDSTRLVANGAFTYSWSTSSVSDSIKVSPAITNVYSVTGTNTFGCQATGPYTVTVNPLPVLMITGSTTICAGNTANLSVSGANTYLWNTASVNTVIAVSPTVSTYYSVTGTDASGCSQKDSALINVSSCAGVAQIISNSYDAYVYPNPTDNLTATVSFTAKSGGSYTVKLLDVFGRMVKEETDTAIAGDNIHVINLEGSAKGIYFIILEKGTDIYKTKLISQ